MRVKRYIVDSMPAAMQRVRSDLGNDAVILSSKEIKIGGFLGMFRQKKIEVIAAVEVDSQAKSEPQQAKLDSVQPAAVPRNMVPNAYKKTADTLSGGLRTAAPTHENEGAAKTGVTATPPAAGKNRQLTELQELAGAIIDRNAQESKTTREEREQARISPAEERLLDEMRQMKQWMAKLSRQAVLKEQLPEHIKLMNNRLLEQEVVEDLREAWIEEAFTEWEKDNQGFDQTRLDAFMREKIKNFLDDRLGGGIHPNTRIVYVAGPTGVGKTTTIAKLAAEQLFRYQRKVGFITADTYRISAVEQLRTYASILNVPLEVVQSPADMQRAIKRLSYCDLILMDTAGRNYRNELIVSELQSLFAEHEKSETYLVLSLTSKLRDMIAITEQFSKYGLDKVIFTKLDETGSFGSILNLIQEFPLQLSYMTNGQNVPDDLLLPDDEMLLNLLLTEGRYD